MTIVEKIKLAFQECNIGVILTREEIVNIVSIRHNVNPSSVIPSDYCYNRTNGGVSLNSKLMLFEYMGNSEYRYLGEHYPYTGRIYAKPRGSAHEIVIGEWQNGRVITSNLTQNPTDTEIVLAEKMSLNSQKVFFKEHKNQGEKRLMDCTIEKTVFTEQKDFPLSTIREMYNDGDIIPNPDYQRDYVYNDKQASKLIESMLIGIPIPVVYLSQEDNGSYDIIDGQQRITSFVRYLDNKFVLSGLTELSELNNLSFKELDKTLQKRLKSSSLKAICLLKESKDLKYEIFARLNQGAVSLKPQELRNCIYRGSLNDMLRDIASSNKLLAPLFHDENNRKTYEERILRFFALRNFNEYKSSILKTMNDFMAAHQNASDLEISTYKNQYNSTIDIIKQVLGDSAFFAYDREKGQFLSKFSGSVYDSIVIPFSFFNKHDLMNHADEIRIKINRVKETDLQYQEDSYAATGSRKRVIGRIMKIYNLLASITGSYGESGEDRLFSTSVKQELFYPGYICSYCNNEILSIDDCEVDHMVPFSLGGKTDISNAQLLHRHCNRTKNDSIDAESETWEE